MDSAALASSGHSPRWWAGELRRELYSLRPTCSPGLHGTNLLFLGRSRGSLVVLPVLRLLRAEALWRGLGSFRFLPGPSAPQGKCSLRSGASQTSGQGVRQPSLGPTARGNPSTGPGPTGRPGLHALSNVARGLGASGRTRKIGGIDLPPHTGRVRTWPCSNPEVYLPRVPGKSHQ